jgi:type I restriction enzyme S subunit
MIDGLHPYPATKDSGLPWLGNMPTHWEVRRNGRLFGPRRETGFPDLPILEVSIRTGVRIRNMENGARKQEMADRSKYQRAARGDIAYNMMRMWQGAVGIAPEDGLVSPAYVVARPFPETDAAYYAYLFRTAAYMREIDTFSRGIVPDRNRLYWESFKQMPSVYPPLDEQRLIVRFLDWHGAQTAKLIRAKKQTIALLNEQKQAIIHRAVTRGLDPNVKLKPSGVPWLGDVPENWQVKRLKYVFARIVGGATPASGEPSYWNGDITWVTPSDVSQTIELKASQRTITEAGLKSCAATLVPSGTIIVTTRAPVGNVAIAKTELATNQGCKALLIDAKTLTVEFAFHIMTLLKAEMQARATGTTFLEISTSRLGDIPVPLPPLSDQAQLCASIANSTSQLNSAIRLVTCEIDRAQEFRTRLIADVVTGKLDVRALAATLPEVADFEPVEEPEEPEEFDEPDDAEDEEVAA